MGRANIKTAQTALSTTAAQIAQTMYGRRAIEVKNLDSSITIYVGQTSSVTSSTGYPIAAGTSFVFEDYDGPLYAVAASGTPTAATIVW